MNILIITFFLSLFSALLFAQETGTFPDPRDGRVYKTVKIGEQWWMNENLDYKTFSGSCYYKGYNAPSDHKETGRLYNWNAASKACPIGWHLPSKSDFDELTKYLNDKNAKDFGFRIGYFGWKNDDGSFKGLYTECIFWSSTIYEANSYYGLIFSRLGQKELGLTEGSAKRKISVRCVCDIIEDRKIDNSIYNVANGSKNVKENSNCISGDCFNGNGTYVWDSGNKYEGQWKNGKMHGSGKYFERDVSTYEGLFENGKKQGTGTLTYWTGEKQSGNFSYDKLEYGTITKDNKIYIGDIGDGGFPNGQGKLILEDKSYVKGNWYYGSLSGNGSVYDKNGTWIYDGIWAGGILTEKTKVASTWNSDDDLVLAILFCAAKAIFSSDNPAPQKQIEEKTQPVISDQPIKDCLSDYGYTAIIESKELPKESSYHKGLIYKYKVIVKKDGKNFANIECTASSLSGSPDEIIYIKCYLKDAVCRTCIDKEVGFYQPDHSCKIDSWGYGHGGTLWDKGCCAEFGGVVDPIYGKDCSTNDNIVLSAVLLYMKFKTW